MTADHPAQALRALIAQALDLCGRAGEMELVRILLEDALTVLDEDGAET